MGEWDAVSKSAASVTRLGCATGGGVGSVQNRSQLHRVLVEQILTEHGEIMREGSCQARDKEAFLAKCIDHMKEVFSPTLAPRFIYSSLFSIFHSIFSYPFVFSVVTRNYRQSFSFFFLMQYSVSIALSIDSN